MALLTLRGIRLAYGLAALLDGIDLALNPGERVCIVGRNGEGKSTLLKILAGRIQPDSGEITRTDGLVTAYLTQELPEEVHGSIFDVVAEGLGENGRLLERYHHLSLDAAQGDAAALEALGRVQAELEAIDGWALQNRVETTLSRLELPADRPFAELSGGLRRRVWLARELVRNPDLLLLDEPTNHLDIAAIAWLENMLAGTAMTVVFITHDRSFMERLATRIVELDRGQLYEHPPSLEALRQRQAERLETEARQNAEFDKKLAQEEAWIRQGIKARRTRNEGRVRALERLRHQRAERRERQGQVRLALNPEQRSGRRVIEAERASFGYDGVPVIRGVDLLLQRGDRLGIVGPNGAGKTTLLRGLLGELAPISGSVTLGTQLEIAYFDQTRAQLDEGATVQDTVGQGRDRVTVNGVTRHVLSYLEDFLFPPARSRQPVSALSGGERNRLLLARLFLRPANLLVLDEPTNDLDVETLELLETLLIEYTGTVIVVSHDRAFLDNVVTSTLVLDGQGSCEEFVGGWSDLPERVTAPLQETRIQPAGPAAGATARAAVRPSETPARSSAATSPAPRKLSYRDARELEQLPARIEQLEAEREALAEQLSDPELFRNRPDRVPEVQKALQRLEEELATAYARWEALESDGS
ncbi:ATP-binding cassette domain-containing protein [Thioalkalivibrio paradoxus]|uniref:ATP-binding protein Uup n=1 Tax=Thioalkalivibrio paradoxus ARh 1 TaxID=713585 RepID=W0DIQ4_9GAMM|nr:ATP-binding cassette domain-containing protein [Thioalkalivibrio paradoxus]AHE97132.1 heme ABC transporter ATPase [Thioalkalivibrio paradoxus ARh 1]